MSRIVSLIILATTAVIFALAVFFKPEWIGDCNEFLYSFINHEYLNILGVILAITLASLSQLHLSIGRLKSKIGEQGVKEIRSEIKSSAVWLIIGFIVGLVAVVIKPLLGDYTTSAATINAICLWILLFYILVLADITLSVFDL